MGGITGNLDQLTRQIAQEITDEIDQEISRDLVMNGPNPWQANQLHFVYVTRARKKVLSMVKLVARAGPAEDGSYDPYGRGTWLVEHVLSAHMEQIGESYMSEETYNEMEAIAWAASQ